MTTEKNFAARPLVKLYNSVKLPNLRQSPSFAAILRDLSTWRVADINLAGRSKAVRNSYESIQMNVTFNSRGKIWNCSLNLPFLHPHATISSNNSNTTTSVRISLVDSTVRNNPCHPSFDSNGSTNQQQNCFTLEAILRWYFDFLIDKNGDQEVIAMFTS